MQEGKSVDPSQQIISWTFRRRMCVCVYDRELGVFHIVWAVELHMSLQQSCGDVYV